MDGYQDPETVEERFEDLRNYLTTGTHDHYVSVNETDTYWTILQEKLAELEEEARKGYVLPSTGLSLILFLLDKERRGTLNEDERETLEEHADQIEELRAIL